MKKNLLVLFEELRNAESLKADAKAEKDNAEEKLYNLISKDLPIKEKIEARKTLKPTIDYWHQEIEKHTETIKWLNMYCIALKAEAIKEAKAIIAQNFIDNFEKVEGVPVRYKKVKAFIDCTDCSDIFAYYREFYNTVGVSIKGEGSREEHLYITKTENGEAVIDKERCETYTTHKKRTPNDIKENIDRFIKAQHELDKAAKEYAEKTAAIKEGCYCIGLDFDGKY